MNLFTMSVTRFSLTAFARAAGTDFSAPRSAVVLLSLLVITIGTVLGIVLKNTVLVLRSTVDSKKWA